ncbi:MAG: hypothetical protein HOV81_31950 [Kofleriaceae bacterium]|nr:hypothetical protein [Kofleriaceae bacterium]
MFESLTHDELASATGGRATCDLSGLPSSAQQIIARESGGDPTAKNPTSTAFGVGQLTIANRRALMGGNANSTDCGAQIQAFQKYTLGRYGSFDRALQFHKRNGWY